VHGDFSEASAFRVDPRTGALAFLNRKSTSGKNPVVLRKNLVWPRIDSGF
jgi:6-phosphogluconolactonase (cycloisomerase 2 family)